MSIQSISRKEKIAFIKKVASGQKISMHERFKFMDAKELIEEWYFDSDTGLSQNFNTGQKLTEEEFDKLNPDKSKIIDLREVYD